MKIFIRDVLKESSFLCKELKVSTCDALSFLIDSSLGLQALRNNWQKYGWHLNFASQNEPMLEESFIDITVFPIHKKISEHFDKNPKNQFETTKFFWKGKLVAYLAKENKREDGVNVVNIMDDELLDLSCPDLKKLLPKLRTTERSFNRIRICNEVVEKQTSDVHKGQGEYNFLINIPEPIKEYFPPVFESRTSDETFAYTLKKINMIDLSRYYLLDTLDDAMVNSILQNIKTYFDKCPAISISDGQWKEKLYELLIEKLESRIIIFKEQSVYLSLNQRMRSELNIQIEDVVNGIKAAFKKIVPTVKDQSLVLSHGDLCFSNILCDRVGSICLIDPRGALSMEECYLPIYYDLGKLSQCFLGNYDGILLGKKVQFETGKKIFFKWIKAMGISIALLRLCEASLFISLLPLHLDNPDKLYEFVLAGISALKSAEESDR